MLAEKCPTCGEVHPRLKFHWKICQDGYPGLRIEIVCPDDSFMEKVFQAERILSQIGIHFDTGYGGARDWEFDWSLIGDHFVWNEKKREDVKVDRIGRH